MLAFRWIKIFSINAVGGIAYDLAEFAGKFWLMEGSWRVSEARSSLEFIEEKDAVLMCHFSWKSLTLHEI